MVLLLEVSGLGVVEGLMAITCKSILVSELAEWLSFRYSDVLVAW